MIHIRVRIGIDGDVITFQDRPSMFLQYFANDVKTKKVAVIAGLGKSFLLGDESRCLAAYSKSLLMGDDDR